MSKLAVYIGRFQPLHRGHTQIINRAIDAGYSRIIFLIGSANKARDVKNPFTFAERASIIDAYMSSQFGACPWNILPVQDYPSDDAWIAAVQGAVAGQTDEDDEISIIGSDRDSSTYYLKSFPQWNADLSVAEQSNEHDLSATTIRTALFSNSMTMPMLMDLPTVTVEFIKKFCGTEEFKLLVSEYQFLQRHAAMWEPAPYPPIFTTVDACVIQSGHILVVRRKNTPGKGLIAVPGGYLNQYERIIDAMIRELREETGLKVVDKVLRGSIVGSNVFDDPGRSLRGRIVTHAYLIRLDSSMPLPHVRGADDAEKAWWMPIAEALAKPEMWFEDHYNIVQWAISQP